MARISCIDKPIPFSRFSGFADNDLWEFFKNKIEISSYGEIGCPLWGFLNTSNTNKKLKYYISRTESNYWLYKCKNNNNNNFEIVQNNNNYVINKKIEIINFDKKLSNKIDLVGIYQYLDHILDPYNFLKKIMKISHNLSFILDDYESEEGLFIQHFTGWNLQTFQWVSEYFNKNLVNNFSKIKKSGNSVYLIYND